MKYRIRTDIRHLDMPEAAPVVTMYFETRAEAETMFRVLYRTRFLPDIHLFKDNEHGFECIMKTEDGHTTCFPVED